MAKKRIVIAYATQLFIDIDENDDIDKIINEMEYIFYSKDAEIIDDGMIDYEICTEDGPHKLWE